MPTDDWFIPKPYGYGARPANWKGWLVTIAFALLCAGSAMIAMAEAVRRDSHTVWLLYFVGLAILITLFALFAKSKTRGEWRWRWGEKELSD